MRPSYPGRRKRSVSLRSSIVARLGSQAPPSRPEAGEASRPAVEDGVPIPPAALVGRVGANVVGDFGRVGGELKAQILDILPADWSFQGTRVLDFGCGAGRLLRHFLIEAETAEFHGCDIDAESIEWLERQLSPPVHVFRNAENPPLPFEDGTFDLVIATSVFTHLSDTWSSWLVEMHRLIAPNGLLVATYLGRDIIGTFDEEWDDERIGMNVLRPLQTWDLGGPMVFHSEWWLREHWGRAFEILVLRERGIIVSVEPHLAQGVVLLQKKAGSVTKEDLERIDPSDSRELLAMRHNIAQLGRESHAFQLRAEWLEQEVARLERERAKVVPARVPANRGRLRELLSRFAGERRGGS
jgi:SAM-dependent methyltransferase